MIYYNMQGILINSAGLHSVGIGVGVVSNLLTDDGPLQLGPGLPYDEQRHGQRHGDLRTQDQKANLCRFRVS